MRTRLCAMMRRPDCSIRALMAPVRLRAVASGLMIENVRSIAIDGHPLLSTGVKTAALIPAPQAASKARRASVVAAQFAANAAAKYWRHRPTCGTAAATLFEPFHHAADLPRFPYPAA